VREDRHLDVEYGGPHGGSEQRLVSLVLGMRDECDARREKLGASGLDVHVAGAVALVECHAVVRGRLVAILELGLGDGGAEVDVPQRRGEGLVRLTALEVAQESELAGPDRVVRDRAVGLGPVDAEAELTEELLERHFVLHGERLAQLDEVAAAHRNLVGGAARLVVAPLVGRREVGVVRQRGIAPHAVVVLHASFGREAVVVPPHRIEDGLAPHPLEPHLDVGVREREHVADVQTAGCRRRGSVDREDALAADLGAADAVEQVRAVLGPCSIPFRLETLECGLVRNVRVGHGVS
jgi:hypothetical protein